ncbi:MAG TPA: hypothetical protein VMI11_00925 [Actinomycetes bacterium]|nr:hypothetical protein [Actinomycetes bacterium]
MTREAESLPTVAVRLRLALLRGALRPGPGSDGRTIGFLLGAIAGAVLSVGALLVLTGLRGDPAHAEDAATVLFTALFLGWVILPVLTFGSDDLLDPSRLVLLPLTGRELMTVLGIGGLVGVAPLVTGIATLGLVTGTAHGPTSALVALTSAALEVVMCVVASRASATALSRVLRSRRGRDLGVALAALVAVSVQLVNPVLLKTEERGGNALHSVASPLRWTPPGLLARAPGLPLAPALLSMAAVAAFIVALLWWWERNLRASSVRPDRSTGSRRRRAVLAPRLVARVLPPGRTGAVTAKDLRYLGRDPRRAVAFATSVLLPTVVVFVSPMSLGERPPAAGVFLVCGVAMLIGLSGMNRFGADGSATWLVLATQTHDSDQKRDLLGGDVATVLAGIPLLVLVGAVTSAIAGSVRDLPAALGVSVCLLLIVVGGSGLVAVLAPFPVPRTGNAFSTGAAGQGCLTSIYSLLCMAGAAVATLPLGLLVVPSFFVPALGYVLLLVGPAYGWVVGGLARRAAVKRWESRAPEILQLLATDRT